VLTGYKSPLTLCAVHVCQLLLPTMACRINHTIIMHNNGQGIEVLEIEKDSLTRKNEFLASSLHTIRRRDQARAAVQRLLGKKP
jgi:hypothetical protein